MAERRGRGGNSEVLEAGENSSDDGRCEATRSTTYRIHDSSNRLQASHFCGASRPLPGSQALPRLQ